MTPKPNVLLEPVLDLLTKSGSVKLREKLLKLVHSREKYLPFVDKYDYKQVKCNGVRSYLFIIEKFVTQVHSDVEKSTSESTISRLSNVADLFLSESRIMDNVLYPTTSKMSFEQIMAEQAYVTKNRMRALLETGHFWLSDDVQAHGSILQYGSAMVAKDYVALVNKKKRHEVTAHMFAEGNTEEMTNLFKLAESPFLNKIIAWHNPVDLVENVQLKLQSELEVIDGTVKERRLANQLKLQIIRHGRSDEFDGVVVLHYHGGGFVAVPPIVHQNWLRRLAKEIPGATIVSPYYRLGPKHKFPAAVQDCLDTYQALTGDIKSNAKELLGFSAKQVVVIGDSAGGNLSIAVGRALSFAKLPAPAKIFCLFPCAQPNIFPTNPSRALMFTDSILPPSFCLNMAEAYAPGDINYQIDRRPWYRREDEMVMHRARVMKKLTANDPIYNLTLGDKLEGFENSDVILMPCEFDPILDDSVDIARKLPNQAKVEFVMAPSVPHSFNLQLSKPAIAATNVVFDKLKGLIRRDE